MKKRLPLLVFAGLGVVVLLALLLYWQHAARWTPERLARTPQYYQLFWDQTPIGQQQQSLEQLPDGNWQWHSHYQLQASVRGTPLNESLDELLIFESKPPYRLRYGEIRRNDALYLLQNDDRLRVTHGDATVIEAAILDFSLSDMLYRLQSVADAPAIGQVLQWRQLDTQQFRVVNLRVEVIGDQDESGVSLLQLALSSEEQTYRSEMWARRDGIMQRVSNGAIEMRWSETPVPVTDKTSDLYLQQAIPTDRALGESKNIVSLTLRWPQQFSLPLQTRADQTVAAGFVRTQAAPSPKATVDEIVQALQPEPRYSSEQSSFVLRARSLTQSLHDDEMRVRSLLLFVRQHLSEGTVLQEQNAADLLRTKVGDCTEFAQLFVALARANDLPAREVSGWVYLGDKQQGFGGHSWAEVVINGRWQSVDPMWNLFGVTAAYLRSGEGEIGAAAMLSHDSRLRFDVEDVRYKQ